MDTNSACRREDFIQKLKEMNFIGPVDIAGKQFMLYHGRAMGIPSEAQYSISQFRFLLKEVEGIASHEEWHL